MDRVNEYFSARGVVATWVRSIRGRSHTARGAALAAKAFITTMPTAGTCSGISGVMTIREAYFNHEVVKELPVSKWVPVPKPSAELELDEPAEHTDAEGNVVTHYKTKFGKRFARVVEPTGFVLWLQEVE